jgi:DNA-binding response OmpR family regulator
MASTEKQLLGTETVKELRSRGVKSTICGLSANDMEEAFMGAGADFFILKPFPCSKSALEGVLVRLVSISRQLR